MLIIFPTIAKKRRNSRQFCEELEVFYEDIRLQCLEIFKENNVKKRRAFFSEPLIKYLWKLFVESKPDAIIHHLRRTRSYPFEGEQRYRALLADMRSLEQTLKVVILPKQAKDDAAISLFNLQETEKDLEETGKFNKRNSEQIRLQLTKMNRLGSGQTEEKYQSDD